MAPFALDVLPVLVVVAVVCSSEERRRCGDRGSGGASGRRQRRVDDSPFKVGGSSCNPPPRLPSSGRRFREKSSIPREFSIQRDGRAWRALGPGGSGVVAVVGGIKLQQAEDDSAAQDQPSSHDPPRSFLLPEAESAGNAIYHANSASGRDGSLRAGCTVPCCGASDGCCRHGWGGEGEVVVEVVVQVRRVGRRPGGRSSSLVPGGRRGFYCDGWLRPSYNHGEREISREYSFRCKASQLRPDTLFAGNTRFPANIAFDTRPATAVTHR